MPAWNKVKIISLLLSASVLAFSFFSNLSQLPVRIWDEARNANNAFSIFTEGHWMVPYYQGSPDMWNTKPPLLIWWQAIDMHIFGVNEWAVRLPAALSACATGIYLWWFCARQTGKPWLGFLCATVLAFTPAYVMNHAGRTGDYDALMVLFMTMSSLSYFLFTEKAEGKTLFAACIFLTLAVLTKGIAGLTLVPAFIIFSLVRNKLFETLRNPYFYKGLLFFIIITGSYYLAREALNPGYLKAVYANELGGRYLETLEGHEHPFSYYFDNMTSHRYRYWIWFLLPSIIGGALNRNAMIRRLTGFNVIILISFFLIISMGGTKLEWYELPLYPFMSLQIGWLLYSLWRLLVSYFHVKVVNLYMLAAVCFIAVFFLPAKSVIKEIFSYTEKPWDDIPHRESYFIKEKEKQQADLSGYVFIYDGYNGQIDFYIEALRRKKINVRLTSSSNDLQPGDRAVVCQEEVEAGLLRSRPVKKLETNSGCTVYLVLSQP